ncbi:MAG: hypothetical protein KGK03_02265 [Candidatus Omnitrophica bacterium]|nr:hypothetical protein [Candidatus Omnitrophota bacterium]MDE2221874.1 hypothetical protein [Candidatus Omnitrophota bacterium]
MKIILLTALAVLLADVSFAGTPQSGWQVMKGQDFVIYYRQDVPNDFIQTTMDTAEDELRDVTDDMGIIDESQWGDKPVKIYIYSNQRDFVQNGGQAGWSHGAAFARARTIKAYPEASGFFDSILPHELGHIVFRDDIGYTAQVPLWFEEGVAIYQEKAKRLGSDTLVREALKNGQFIPLSQLTGMRLYKNTANQVVDVFYTESASVVHYMIEELGRREFLMLCDELKSGTPFQTALHKVYLTFRTIDDLNQAWVDYLQG